MIASEFHHQSTNGEESAQCADEQTGVHRLQYLDLDGTAAQTSEDETQCLVLAEPPLSLLVEISQGPKILKPTFVKGGLVSIQSGGGFAMCCVEVAPRNFFQVTQDSSSKGPQFGSWQPSQHF